MASDLEALKSGDVSGVEEAEMEVDSLAKSMEEETVGGDTKEVKDEEGFEIEDEVPPQTPGKSEEAAAASPVTSTDRRRRRETKAVEWYSQTLGATPIVSVAKPISIEQGGGTCLKDIPNVAFKLSKRNCDDNLQLLHKILFGRPAKNYSLKKNIGLFSGYVWAENEEKQRLKVKERLDKCVRAKLVHLCDILDIPVTKSFSKKEDMSTNILEFLESPHATTESLLSEKKGKKRKGKAKSGKSSRSAKKAIEAPAKKQKQNSKSGEKRKRSNSVKDDEEEHSESQNGSQKDEENDGISNIESDQESRSEDEDEDFEPKRKTHKNKKLVKEGIKESEEIIGDTSKDVKTDSSAKSSTSAEKVDAKEKTSKSKVSSKKQKAVKDNNFPTSMDEEKMDSRNQTSESSPKVSAEDNGKEHTSENAKTEPSKEEMHAFVVNYLKEVDFSTATLSDVLKQIGSHFGLDLKSRKAEVKAILTEVISNMSDDEEDEEDEEALENDNDA